MKTSVLLASLSIAASAWGQSPITIQKSLQANQQEGKEVQIERLVLADSAGLSLYTFSPDKPSESTCYDACAKAWPPVLVTEVQAQNLTGSLGTTIRKDQTLQLTVDQRPVYLFAGDGKAGDINGEGLGGVWFLIDIKLSK